MVFKRSHLCAIKKGLMSLSAYFLYWKQSLQIFWDELICKFLKCVTLSAACLVGVSEHGDSSPAFFLGGAARGALRRRGSLRMLAVAGTRRGLVSCSKRVLRRPVRCLSVERAFKGTANTRLERDEDSSAPTGLPAKRPFLPMAEAGAGFCVPSVLPGQLAIDAELPVL